MSSKKKVNKILNQLRKRYHKNVSYMINNLPDFYKNLFGNQGKLKAEIEIDPTGGHINLKINGTYLAEKNKLFNLYRKQFDDFRKTPGLIVAIVGNDIPDGIDTLNHKYLRKMLSFPGLPQKITDIFLDTKLIPYIVVFGTGLGYHIEWLIENYEIMHMHIIDIDVELIKPSLYTINWEKVLSYFQQPYRSISFTVGVNDPILITGEIVNKIWEIHPAFGIVTYVYEHYENQQINIIKESVKERFLDVLRGYGFFDDEIWAVEHTAGNISNNIPVYYGDHKVPDSNTVPAFIVASGPSLDTTIDYIKKNRENAVIFSCGTAVNRLLEEGVTPDFHIEIERTKDTYDKLMFKYDEHLFRDLFIVAASNVYPEVFKITSESAMFLKGDDAGMVFFEDTQDIERLYHVNPTVTNGAFALCSSMGFKEVYMFGTDFGYTDPKKHHSRGTVYDDKDFVFFKEEFPSSIKVKGNFRDYVYTEDIFLFSKNVLEKQIRNNKNMVVYNTSDGAFIEGTVPLNPSSLKQFSSTKHWLVSFLRKNFRRDYRQKIDICKKLDKFKKETKKHLDEIIRLHDGLIYRASQGELLRLFYDINQFLKSLPAYYQILFRGSIWQFNVYLYINYLAVPDDISKNQFVRWSGNVSVEFFRECKNLVDKIEV